MRGVSSSSPLPPLWIHPDHRRGSRVSKTVALTVSLRSEVVLSTFSPVLTHSVILLSRRRMSQNVWVGFVGGEAVMMGEVTIRGPMGYDERVEGGRVSVRWICGRWREGSRWTGEGEAGR